MEEKKKKRIVGILIFLIILVLLIIFWLIFFWNKGLFYENVYDFLVESKSDDRDVEEQFLIDNELYDEDFVCENIVYENGSLEFFDCDIDDDHEDYCVYDGEEFDCYDKDFDSDLSVNYKKIAGEDTINGYVSEDVILSTDVIENSDLEISKKFVCYTSLEKCIPDEEIDLDTIDLNLESKSSKVCIMAEYTNGEKSDIICSDSFMIDKTGPVIDYKVSGTLGDNGWYKSNVSINDYSAVDSVSGLDTIDISKISINYETGGENIIITAVDKAGNVSTKTVTIKIDKTAPVAGDFIVNGTLGNNGWYTSDLDIAGVGGSDNLSGVARTTVSKSKINYDTDGEVIILTTRDNAGNVSTKELSVKVDRTLPIIDYKVEGVLGDNGWYKSDIEINDYTGNDLLSGLSSININKKNINYETSGEDIIITAVDNAGNSNILVIPIKIDKTAPIIGDFNVLGTTGNNGWYKSDVFISGVAGSDLLSGLDSTDVSKKNINYNTSGEEIILTTKDKAGNVSTKSITIKVDKIAPVIDDLVVSGTMGLNGWYTTNVVVENPVGNDNLSGLDTIGLNKNKFTSETSGTDIVATAVDKAGNTSELIVPIKIDKVAPVIDNYDLVGTKGLNNWYTTDVSLKNIRASDGFSGVNTEKLNLIDINIDYETKGKEFSFEVVDNAGNKRVEKFNVKIDKSIPLTGEIILDGAYDADTGMYDSNVVIETVGGSDDISGIWKNVVEMHILTGVTLETDVKLTTFNNAGLKDDIEEKVKINKVIPEVGEIVVTGTEGDNDWYTSDVIVGVNDLRDGLGLVDLLEIKTNTTGIFLSLTTEDTDGATQFFEKTLKVDKEVPVITQKEEISFASSEDIDLLEYFSVKYGVSSGNLVCDVVDTTGYAPGTYPLNCTARSNAGLEDVINTTFEVYPLYTEIDYVELNNGQYINTGLSSLNDYTVTMDVYLTEAGWIFGGREFSDKSLGLYVDESLEVYSSYGGEPLNVVDSLGNKLIIELDTWYNIIFSNSAIIVDGVSYLQNTGELSDNSITIGGLNQVGSVNSEMMNGRIDNVKFENNSTGNVNNFIPVQMTDSSEIGFYDTVGEVFYKSSGSKEFIAP